MIPLADGAFDGSGDRGWEWSEHDLAAFAVDLQDAVAVLLTEIFDVGTTGFEDPQAQETEHGDQREVVRVG